MGSRTLVPEIIQWKVRVAAKLNRKPRPRLISAGRRRRPSDFTPPSTGKGTATTTKCRGTAWDGPMPETGGANIKVAHRLNEKEEHSGMKTWWHQVVEMAEAIILAMVAITTAWSGYQAARWDADQSVLYGRSSRLRVEGQALEVQSNQAKQYNAGTVADWLRAEADGKANLSAFFERRILPDFRPAFEAWKKTDPLHNPNAPAGPTLMPEFRDTREEEATRKDQEATDLFEEGTRAREIGDNYVRVTVFLATVLFLVAMSQRFKSAPIRVMLIAVAFVLLCFPLWQILALPRA